MVIHHASSFDPYVIPALTMTLILTTDPRRTGAAELTDGGELSIARLVGTPHAVSFVARVTSIEGNLKLVQVRRTRHVESEQSLYNT